MAYSYGTDEWVEKYVEMAQQRLASEKKPYILATPEWVATYEKLMREDDIWSDAAQDWEGSVALCILANEEVGINENLYMFMDLWHGVCHSIRLVPKDAGEAANFVIAAQYDIWKSVIAKELDVVKGMMQGKLTLDGELAAVVRGAKAFARGVDLAASIGTRFQGDLSPDERDKYIAWAQGVREEFGS